MILSRPLIALDIGSSSVKIAELSGTGTTRKLRNLGLELIPEGAVINGDLKKPELVLKAIKNLIKALKINPKGRRIALSISGIGVILKRMTLTPDDEVELGEQVFEEAKQQFHHDMSDMYFRFQEIPSHFVDEGEKAFLIVAGKIDVIEQYIDLVHKLGMKVGVIDTDTFCLSNLFSTNYPIGQSLIVLANIGASSTQVVLTYEGEYLYSREFSIGGNAVTRKIAENLNIDLENAESLKISASTGDQVIAEKIRPSVAEINDQIIQEIVQTTQFFVQNENIAELSEAKYVFLSGGASITLDLAGSLSSSIRAPVQIINPFQKIDAGSSGVDMEYLLSQGAIYGVSIGLAMRKVGDA